MRGEVTHAVDPDDRDRADAGRLHSEGRLSTVRAGAVHVTAPTPRWRLRDTVELFHASDGNLYILRGAARSELMIEAPGADVLALFDHLRGDGASCAELEGAAGMDEAAARATLEQLAALRLIEPSGSHSRGLSTQDATRFDRQLPYFADVGPDGADAGAMQRRLRASRVLILGCGGLGSWTLAALACAGVGSFVLVDDDDVELSNLNRQLLFAAADVGKPKVACAAAAVTRFDPEIELRTVAARIERSDDLRVLLDRVDLVVETADWPPYLLSRWVQEACGAAAVAHISAGQFPPGIRVGPLFVPGGGACHWCLEEHARERYPLYDELAEMRSRERMYAATLGPASGLIGSMLAMEVVHHLTGLCSPATLNTALIGDLRTGEWQREPVEQHERCRSCTRSDAHSSPSLRPRKGL